MTIKAIETEYKGYKFRSRLEARWAVFFDTAQIPWEYEKEGYELSNGERYLPDFYLPTMDIYVEVKGEKPNKVYMDKLSTFITESETTVLLVIGTMDKQNCVLPFKTETEDTIIIDWFSTNLLISCLAKGELWFTKGDINKDFKTVNDNLLTINVKSNLSDNNDLESEFLKEAFERTDKCINAMKQARFEHGETPMIATVQPTFMPTTDKEPIVKNTTIEVTKMPTTIEEEFEILWEAYPRKMGKLYAFKAYEKAREKEVSFGEVLVGLEEYLKYVARNKVEDKFIKYGQSWFAREGWNDRFN